MMTKEVREMELVVISMCAIIFWLLRVSEEECEGEHEGERERETAQARESDGPRKT